MFLEWNPQVAVDLHEMGGNSTYFFAPPAAPRNPHLVSSQDAWHERLGRAIAAMFDERGQAYFVREVFDSFYPGYGETWPMTHGAVGMTFEQASARGLVFRRDDDTELTYLDGIRNHFTAALTTAATAARGREALLADFLEFRRSAVSLGETGVREYVLLPGADPARARRLAGLLVGQGIEVRLAEEELRAGDRRFPAGQLRGARSPSRRDASCGTCWTPRSRWTRPSCRSRTVGARSGCRNQIYDVTAWSLPLVFDVECVGTPAAVAGRTRAWALAGAGRTPALESARVAWLLPWGTGTAAAVAEALQAGIKVRVAEGETTLGGRTASRPGAPSSGPPRTRTTWPRSSGGSRPGTTPRRCRWTRAIPSAASRWAACGCGPSGRLGCCWPGTRPPPASPRDGPGGSWRSATGSG